jgi:ribosome maturation factor RimP
LSELTDLFEREVDAIAHERSASGVEVVTHAAHARRGMTNLTVTIDKDGGVDLATCERIAARINHALEAIDLPYSLEVESAGLERPLIRPHREGRTAPPARDHQIGEPGVRSSRRSHS